MEIDEHAVDHVVSHGGHALAAGQVRRSAILEDDPAAAGIHRPEAGGDW
jgi:hypothetical protein